MNGKAIVVVHMQTGFLRGVDNRMVLFYAQGEVLRYAAKKDIPVAVLRDDDGGLIISEIQEELERVSRKEVIPKTGNNGFLETNLEKVLRDWRARDLYFMGILGFSCVTATAEDAVKREFNVFTADDVIANGVETEKNLIGHPKWYVKGGTYFRDYEAMISHMDR